MSDAPPVRLLLLAPPTAPEGGPLLARARTARAAGRAVEVLLAGRGLEWLGDADLGRLSEQGGVGVGFCSRSARDHGLRPDTVPTWARWTSLVAWFTALEPDAELWGLLP